MYLRRGLAASGVAALLLSGLAVPALAGPAVVTSAAAPHAASAEARGAQAKPVTRTKLTTAYGKKPVKTTAGKRYTLVFKGRKGDRVRIAAVRGKQYGIGLEPIERRTLLGPKGYAITAASDGYATLKRSGTYRIRFTALSSRTQLLTLVTRSATSKQVKLPARTGHQYAVDVRTEVGSRITTIGGVAGLRTGGTYSAHDGDSMWFDASTLIAARGQSLLGADGYADWDGRSERPVVGQNVRVYLTPQKAATVTPRPMIALRAKVSGPGVTIPRTATGGAVISLDTSGVGQEYATVMLDGVGGGMQVRSVQGRGVSQGGWNNQIVDVEDVARRVVLVPPAVSDRTCTAVPTPVHPATLVVGGDRLQMPARADGLDTFVRVSSPDVVEASLTVHDAPEQRFQILWGYPIMMESPRGCNGCGEFTLQAGRIGTHRGYGLGYGVLGGMTVGTSGAPGTGIFELSMAPDPR